MNAITLVFIGVFVCFDLPRVTGEARVRITGFRNFRSRDDFTERWEEREVSLSRLTSLDFYIPYWSVGSFARERPTHARRAGQPRAGVKSPVWRPSVRRVPRRREVRVRAAR